jgi:hypothetical protein
MINLNPLEKSKLHCNIVRVLNATSDSREDRARQAWAFLVSHLDHVDYFEAMAAAEVIADAILDANGFLEDFTVSLKSVRALTKLDMDTACHGLMLLGAIESGRDSDLWSTGLSNSVLRLGLQ